MSHESITIGNRQKLKVYYVGNIDLVFYGSTDEWITIVHALYILGSCFNLYLFYEVQTTQLSISNATGAQIVGTKAPLSRNRNGLYLFATLLPSGTGKTIRNREMRANAIIK